MGSGKRAQPRVTEHERELAGLVDRRARAFKELQSDALTKAERKRLQAEIAEGEKALKEFWVLNEKRIAYRIHEKFIPTVEKGDGLAIQSLSEFAKTWGKPVTGKQSFAKYAKTSRFQDALDVLQSLYLDLPEKMLTYDATKGELISYLYRTADNAAYQFMREHEWEAKNVTDIDPLHETLADPTLETLAAEHDKGGPGEAPLVPEEPDDKQSDELGGDLHGETPESLAAWHELSSGQAYSPSDSLGHVTDPDQKRAERARRRDARKDTKYTWEIYEALKQARATLSPFEEKVYGLRLIGYRTKDIAEQLDLDQELIERTLLQAYNTVRTFLTLHGFKAQRLALPGASLAGIKQRITHLPLGDKTTTSPGDEAAAEEIEQAEVARLAAMRAKIAALSPKLRQTIELMLEGKDYSEIAGELGVTEETVRQRVKRGRGEMSQKEQLYV